MLLHVDVTAEDITRGAACKSDRCPVALALLRALNAAGIPADMVSVGPSRVVWFASPHRVNAYNLPDIAKDFIREFDEGWNMALPFSFDLDIYSI